MSTKRYPKSRDGNEKPIVNALRAHGCKVWRIEGGPGSEGVLDLLVEYPDRAIDELIGDLEALSMCLDHDRRYISDIERVEKVVHVLRRREMAWMVMEVKNPDGKTGGGKGTIRVRDLAAGAKYREVLRFCTQPIARLCKESQGDFLLAHSAPMAVVTSVAEALAAVGIEQGETT